VCKGAKVERKFWGMLNGLEETSSIREVLAAMEKSGQGRKRVGPENEKEGNIFQNLS